MSFATPVALLLLLAVPALVAVVRLLERRNTPYAVSFTNLELLAAIRPRRNVRRFVPLGVFLLACTSAGLAAAGPRLVRTQRAEAATVVLLVDVSGSMASTDVQPSRLGAAQQAMTGFLRRLPSRYRVGLVAFGGSADVLARPTSDRTLLQEDVNLLVPGAGTAIGDGLLAAVQLVRSEQLVATGGARAPAAIILLSDGTQTAGSATPLDGADAAGRAGIRVDTIALGTDHGVPNASGIGGPGPLGGTVGFGGMTAPMPPDLGVLQQIADATDGGMYTAASAPRLDRVYGSLASSVFVRHTRREIGSFLAGGAALLLLASLGATRLLGPKLP